MKKVLLVLTVLAFNLSNAQGKGVFLNGKKMNTTKVNSIKVSAGASMFIVGVGSIKTRAILSGNTSRNLVDANELKFTFNFGSEEKDDFSSTASVEVSSPNDLYLFKLKSKKNSRELLVGTMGTFSGASVGLDSDDAIQYDYAELEAGLYEVTLPSNLPNGEYAFVSSQWTGVTSLLWTFTIENSDYISPAEQNKIDKARRKQERKNRRNN